jgi:hypothetical protein
VMSAHEPWQAPSWQICPAPQVTPAHLSTWQAPGEPRHSWPSGQPVV